MKRLGFSGFFLAIIVIVAIASGCAGRGASMQADGASEDALAAVDKALEKSDQVEVSVDDNKIICRREAVAGSHFPKRVCRTAKQIEQERAESQRQLELEKSRQLNKALIKIGG